MESSVQRRVEAISRHLLSLPREPNFFLHQVKIISFTVFIFIFYNDLLYGAIYSHSHVVYLLTQLCFLMGFFFKGFIEWWESEKWWCRSCDHRGYGVGHSCHSFSPCQSQNHHTWQGFLLLFPYIYLVIQGVNKVCNFGEFVNIVW